MIRGSVMNSMRTGARARADQSSRRGLYAEPSLADLTDAWAHAAWMGGMCTWSKGMVREIMAGSERRVQEVCLMSALREYSEWNV